MKNKISKSLLLLFLLPCSLQAQGISEDELYQKVFGQKMNKRQIQIEVFLRKRPLGLVWVEVEGSKLISINAPELLDLLEGVIDRNKLSEIDFTGWRDIDHFDLGIIILLFLCLRLIHLWKI